MLCNEAPTKISDPNGIRTRVTAVKGRIAFIDDQQLILTCANKVPISSLMPAKKKDETDAWPFMRWIESRQRWMVDARTKVGGQRRFFETKDEALGWRTKQDVKSERTKATPLSRHRAATYGWTVQQAIKFAVAHLKQQATSKPVSKPWRLCLISSAEE